MLGILKIKLIEVIRSLQQACTTAVIRDDDGDEITSCIVKFGAAHATREPRQPAPSSAAAAALNELDHLAIAGRARPSHTRRAHKAGRAFSTSSFRRCAALRQPQR